MITKVVRIAVWLPWLMAMAAMPVTANGAASVLLEQLTWTELQEQVKSGKTTIIVPIGGTEQNGPHMALGKHNVRVAALAEKIAVALGNAVVAPVIAYVPEGALSPPTGHMRFPGTITITDQAFEATLEYAAKSFATHGFRDVVFLGDHGGYQNDEKRVAERLNREWAATGARAHAIGEYYRASATGFAKALEDRGYTEQEIGTHAGLADTSLTLALAPGAVRKDRAASTGPDRAQGVYGDPRRASAALGEVGVNLIVAQSVAAIRKAVARR